MRVLLVVLAVLAGASQASAANPCEARDDSLVAGGFLTAAKLNDLKDNDLTLYAVGFLDAWHAGMLIGASEPCLRKIMSCMDGRTGNQLGAMLRKYSGPS